MQKIKFVCNAVKWFDKVNGNTYHSVTVQRVKDGKILKGSPIVYGYGDQYRQTALALMLHGKFLPKKYDSENLWSYERENDYSILWNVHDGLKRDMINNVK